MDTDESRSGPDSDQISDSSSLEVEESDGSSNAEPKPKVIALETLLASEMNDLEDILGMLTLKEKGKNDSLEEAGPSITEDKSSDIPTSSTSRTLCSNCVDPVSGDPIISMDCGHGFCDNCWTNYLVKKIESGKGKTIRCMEEGCPVICKESIVKYLFGATDPDLVEKFNRSLIESSIARNEKAKMCPRNSYCGNIISVDGDEICEVECSCGFQFCFKCLEQPHSPCSCEMWKLWKEACKYDSAPDNLILERTKSCPNCYYPMERTGGCNHVTCANCQQPFCWICGEVTAEDHTATSLYEHNCGQYEADYTEESMYEEQDVHRFRHYHKLYTIHIDSFEKEKELKEEVQNRISSSGPQPLYVDLRWVDNGFHSLSMGRWVLVHSYPFAYYVFGEEMFGKLMTVEEREKKLKCFQFWQHQFEFRVEMLSATFNDLKVPVDEISVKNIFELSESMDIACESMYDFIMKEMFPSLPVDIEISRGITKATPVLVGDSSSSST